MMPDFFAGNFFIGDNSFGSIDGFGLAGTVYAQDPECREAAMGRAGFIADGFGFFWQGGSGTAQMNGRAFASSGAESRPCALPVFETTVHGFTVKGVDVQQTKEGVLIRKGSISINGKDIELRNLGLRGGEIDGVYRTGTAPVDIEVDSGYAKNIRVKGISIEASGVYADSVSVPLPEGNASSWTFSHVRMFGDGRYSASSTDRRTLTIGGYRFTAADTEFDGTKVIAHTGYVRSIAGFNKPELELLELSFNASGVISGGKLKEQPPAETPEAGLARTYSYKFDGWMYNYDDMHLASDGLHGTGAVNKYDEAAGTGLYVTFTDFLVTADSAVTSGTSTAETNRDTILINGFFIDLPNSRMTVTDTGHYVLVCEKPEILLGDSAESKIYLGRLVLDSSESIIESDLGSAAMKLRSYNDYRISIAGAKIDSTGVWIDGAIGLKSWSDGAKTTSSLIHLLPGFSVTFEDPEAELTYDFFGWTVHGKGVSFKENSAVIKENVIVYRGHSVDLGMIEFYLDGSLADEVINYQNIPVDIVTTKSKLIKTTVTKKGITGDFKVVLPEQFYGNEITYRDVQLKRDGSFYTEDAKNTYKLNLGAVVIDMDYVRLTPEGLKSDAIIKLENLDQAEIKLRGIIIGNDGNVTLEGEAKGPLQLWNMTFLIKNVTISNEVIDIQAECYLPQRMPGAFSGRSVWMQSFRIGLDGTVQQFDASMDGDYVVPFIDDFAISTSGLTVGLVNGLPCITFKTAGLIFPAGFVSDIVPLENLSFDPIQKTFDFDSFTAKFPICARLNEIRFDFMTMAIGQDKRIRFSGSAVFEGDQYPDALRGKRVTVTELEIQRDGAHGLLSFDVDGLSGREAAVLSALRPEDTTVRIESSDGGKSRLFMSGPSSAIFAVLGSGSGNSHGSPVR
jgi:hypothetical protein